MLLETLDTEKLFTNGLAIVPWRLRLRASEDSSEKRYQNDLSSARSRSDLFIDSSNRDSSYPVEIGKSDTRSCPCIPECDVHRVRRHIGSIHFIFRPTGLSHGQRLQQFGRHQINDHDDAGPDEHHKGGASKPTSRPAGFR